MMPGSLLLGQELLEARIAPQPRDSALCEIVVRKAGEGHALSSYSQRPRVVFIVRKIAGASRASRALFLPQSRLEYWAFNLIAAAGDEAAIRAAERFLR